MFSANFVVESPADAGPLTLRDAITAANANAGPDAITFALPAGTTINLASPLPTITDAGLAIDGDLNADGSPDITIRGTRAFDGLVSLAQGTAVRWMVIAEFRSGVVANGTGASLNVEGCRIDGMNGMGIHFLNGASGVATRNSVANMPAYGQYGISTHGAGANTVVTDNSVTNADLGIAFGVGATGTAIGNHVTHTVRAGIVLWEAGSGVTIEANVVDAAGEHSFLAQDTPDFAFLRNTSTNTAATHHGIWVKSGNGTIEANRIIGGYGGVSLLDCTPFTATSNMIVGTDASAFSVQSSNGSVQNNQVTECGYGIWACLGSDATVEGNTIDQARSTGVTIAGGATATVRNNTITGPTDTGVHVCGSGGTVTVEGNTIEDCANYGVHLPGPSPNHGIVRQNTISNCGHGIAFGEAATGEITDNEVSDASTYGISLWRAGQVPITGNTVLRGSVQKDEENWNAAIQVTESAAVTPVPIERNTVIDSLNHGIAISSSKADVLANTVTNVGYHAIAFYNGQGQVTGNTVTGAAKGSIWGWDGGNDLTITDNVTEGGLHGIAVTGGTAIIERNEVRDADDVGIAVSANHWPATATIRDNTITGAVDGMRLCSGAEVTVEENTIDQTTASGMRIAGPSASDTSIVTARNNTITDPGQYGLAVCGNSQATLEDNTVTGSGLYGVWVHYGGQAELARNTITGSAGAGVSVLDAGRATLSECSIYDNDGLGIDLGGDGVTANDPGDADEGPNDLLNYPEFTNITESGTDVSVQGIAPGGSTIELFTAAPDPSGHGEGKTFIMSVTADGSGLFTATVPAATMPLTATATDADGNTSEFGRYTNYSPEITSITAAVEPVQVSTVVDATVTFEDEHDADPHTVVFDWGDGNTDPAIEVPAGGRTAAAQHTYSAAGVYAITVTVTDSLGASDTGVYEFVVIYNPDGGFVTGGGWIMSPEGAYALDPALTGKASFGFNSKYKKGAEVPTGQTQFQFKVADLNFHSSTYQWLVVAGTKAQYKGTGTINGDGEYGFMLTAIDGDLKNNPTPDAFRIKIWDKATDQVVYDNKMGSGDGAEDLTALGGGQIVVHKGDDAAAGSLSATVRSASAIQTAVGAEVLFTLSADAEVTVTVLNMAGRPVRRLTTSRLSNSGVNRLAWNACSDTGLRVPHGTYLVEIDARGHDGTASRGLTSLRLGR